MPGLQSTPLSPTPSMRRFLTRAEAAILIGMVLVISSLFLTWKVQRPEPSPLLAMGAVHVESLSVQHDGFGAGCAWPLTICAALCACTLLWDVTAKNRMALAAVGGAGAFACVIIALTRFAPLPGVGVGLMGGVLLCLGIADRCLRPDPAQAVAPTGRG